MDDRIKAKTLNVDFDTDGIVVVTWRHPKTGEVAGQSFARFVHTPETVALAAAREEGRKKEREACAKVADDVAELAAARRTHYRQEGSEVWAGEAHAEASGAQRIAAAIRARNMEGT